MNLKKISIVALQAVGLTLAPAAALANTTKDVTYTATVPGTCTYTGMANENVTLTYDSSAQTLSGTTGDIGITCNFNANATLSAVTTNAEPSGLSTSFNLALQSGGSPVISSDGTAASSNTSLGLTSGVAKTFTMPLTVNGAASFGDYSYTVTLTVLDGAGE